jgi:hypothetical protein
MTISRKGLADEIDRVNDELAELQTAKREIFDAYREQLKARGKHDTDIKLEIAAIKAAIRQRRALALDPFGVEAHDTLVTQILTEITGKEDDDPSRATRARETDEDTEARVVA